jgi:moderate conductance mechanosensitive channel
VQAGPNSSALQFSWIVSVRPGNLRRAINVLTRVMLWHGGASTFAVRIASQPVEVSGQPPAVSGSFSPQHIVSALLVVGVELAAIALVVGTLYFLTTRLLLRLGSRRESASSEWRSVAKAKARTILLVAAFLLAAAVLAFNGWLLARGIDARTHSVARFGSITAERWTAIAVALGKLLMAAAALFLGTRLMRRLLRYAEQALHRWHQPTALDHSVAKLFSGVDRIIVNTAWLLLGVYGVGWLGLPEMVASALLVALRIYLVIAVGLLVIRCTDVAVGTLEGLSERTARQRGWLHYYDKVRPLLPTLRACLEYALWIGMGSIVLLQLAWVRDLAAWGPRLIQAIGVFFAGRVLIELGELEIQHRMLPAEGLDETERRRRTTIVPLLISALVYAGYFGIAVLILSVLGFNPVPFLAGAGILGLVIGFGAQSLINDVVSGFFILLENVYLVGDVIEVGGARGVVEAIEFRTTKIRDADGRVHIIRNGDMKPIVNYSKGYTMAVVNVDVAYDADLDAVFGRLRQAGARLRAENPDVLAETEIDGIVSFGASTMTVRTSTRVRPGRHDAVAAVLRLMVKETFDRQAPGVPRKTLIPATVEGHSASTRGR